MKDRKGLDWIPLWSDKWLSGSTRLELEPDERSVWADFLALAAKDNGWIRANEGIPYLDKQLAGWLCIDEELLNRAREKFIKYGKLKIHEDGTMEIVNWGKYQLSDRWRREVEKKWEVRYKEEIKQLREEVERLRKTSGKTEPTSDKTEPTSGKTEHPSKKAEANRDRDKDSNTDKESVSSDDHRYPDEAHVQSKAELSTSHTLLNPVIEFWQDLYRHIAQKRKAKQTEYPWDAFGKKNLLALARANEPDLVLEAIYFYFIYEKGNTKKVKEFERRFTDIAEKREGKQWEKCRQYLTKYKDLNPNLFQK